MAPRLSVQECGFGSVAGGQTRDRQLSIWGRPLRGSGWRAAYEGGNVPLSRVVRQASAGMSTFVYILSGQGPL